MGLTPTLISLLATSAFFQAATAVLGSSLGQYTTIPKWKVQSSARAGSDAAELALPGVDVSSWYSIGPKATLMSTLLANNVYKDSELFYSNNLDKIDHAQFQVPWFYRSEFELESKPNSRFQLKTNGISSRADIYFNGKLVADKNIQAGAYGGLIFDVSSAVKQGSNILLVKVYPTDYNQDFALGFVDWNPYPPDNGTGVWREIEIKETGQLSIISLPRVQTDLGRKTSIKLDLKNWASSSVKGGITCEVLDSKGNSVDSPKKDFNIGSKGQSKVSLEIKVKNPEIWWPKQWGEQPLYSASCTARTDAGLSDSTPKIRFGIRTVTSSLNAYNDTMFSINGKPFQVLGGGYTSDIFLRFDENKLREQFQYVLDMGLNTVRLEGKQEHPRLYEIADEMGVMVMAGWECCDKWEGWTYNDEGSGKKWDDADYAIANMSMRHEAEMMQHHPSMLAFLVGSDFWPDDRAVKIYVDALRSFDWDVPVIASASQRGYPELLGNGGMKMDGPYDWVPPNYWYGDQLGAAFGFGSELGAGVGTPEISSLKKFLSSADQDDLWKNPNKGLYHMSTNVSSFYTREIYNKALWARYGAPSSLSDYLLKAQMMDYEATRAQYEAYTANWNAKRPALGLIYWMLNNAWPSLHWNLFDYYLHPAGSYFGAKVGCSRAEHAVYNYKSRTVHLINRSLDKKGSRTVEIELLGLDGKVLAKRTVSATTIPNTSKQISEVPGIDNIKDVALLKLVLNDSSRTLSRNVYWLSSRLDTLDWDSSTWYHTPVTNYSDFTALSKLKTAELSIKASSGGRVVLENQSKVPAVFVRLNLVDGNGNDVLPVIWSDNYVSLWPGEKIELEVRWTGYSAKDVGIKVDGRNVETKLTYMAA